MYHSFFHRFPLISLFALALLFTACQQENVDQIAEDEQALADVDAIMEASYEELDLIAEEGLDISEGGSYQNAAVVASCVIITNDTALKRLTLDFGTGCLGADGKTRAGKLYIDYTRRLWIPGATRTITPDSFYVEGVKVEGVKTLTNVSSNFQEPITINVVITGGQLTWPNGDVATRTVNRTKVWDRGATLVADVLRITGTAQGTTRNGVSYTNTIDSELVYRRACRFQGYRLPAEGVITVQRSGQDDLTIDFGGGTCDNELTLSKNGQSITITI